MAGGRSAEPGEPGAAEHNGLLAVPCPGRGRPHQPHTPRQAASVGAQVHRAHPGDR